VTELCPKKYKRYVKDAGFIGVKEVYYKWPINACPIDQYKKEKGNGLCRIFY
jgi:hypothetical protein